MDLSKSSFSLLSVNVLSNIIGFAALVAFTNKLSPHQIGVFFLFQSLLNILETFTDLGIDESVIKRISEGNDPQSIISTSILIKSILTMMVIILVNIFDHRINSYLGNDLALLLSVFLLLESYSRLSLSILQGKNRVGEIALPNFVRRGTYAIVGYFLVMNGFGERALIYGLFVGVILQLIIAVKKISIGLGAPTANQAISIYEFAKYSFVSRISGSVYAWLDVAIIGLFLTQSAVGVYETAWRVSIAVMMVINAISATIYPQISQWAENDEIHRIESLIPSALAPGMFLLIPACAGAAYLSRDILDLLFGSAYSSGWYLLIIFMIGKLIQANSNILSQVLHGLDRPDLALRSRLLSLLINIILNIILINLYGLPGIAIATVISVAIAAIAHAHYVSRFMTIKIPFIRISGSIVAASGMVAVLSQIRTLVEVESIPALAAMVIAGIILYGAFALLIPPLRIMILMHTRQIIPRLSP